MSDIKIARQLSDGRYDEQIGIMKSMTTATNNFIKALDKVKTEFEDQTLAYFKNGKKIKKEQKIKCNEGMMDSYCETLIELQKAFAECSKKMKKAKKHMKKKLSKFTHNTIQKRLNTLRATKHKGGSSRNEDLDSSPSTGEEIQRYDKGDFDFHESPGKAFRHPSPSLTGLLNLRNTCYMNSTIQCLSNTWPLVRYVITDQNINGHEEGQLLDDFAFLVKALWSGQYSYINPKFFKETMGRYQKTFAGYEKQDAQEFLSVCLIGLNQILNQVKVHPDIERPDDKGLSDERAAEMFWQYYILHDDSIFVDLFHGLIKVTISCRTCDAKSRNFMPSMALILPIPKSNPNSNGCTLDDCLRLFSKEESVTETCMNCGENVVADRKLEISKLPPILIIILKRFVNDGRRKKKNDAHIDFEMNLSIGPAPKMYNLYAVSNHHGTSLASGYYTACCKNPFTQKWYRYEDTHVFETSESKVKSSDAYVLYYMSSNEFTNGP